MDLTESINELRNIPNMITFGYDCSNDDILLVKAIYYGYINVIRHLIDNNISNIHVEDRDGNTTLMLACDGLYYRLLDIHVHRVQNILDATYEKYFDIMRCLMNHGVNINATNVYGETPIIRVCTQLYPLRIMKFLVSNGADVTVVTTKQRNMITHSKGDTLLLRACKNWESRESIDMIKFILSLDGVDAMVNMECDHGDTALVAAAKFELLLPVIKALVEHGATNIPTALEYATRNWRIRRNHISDIVQYLQYTNNTHK